MLQRLLAILAQRCPVCLEGQAFHGLFAMHKTCPRCGLRFERETGYFLNAMFALGFLVLIPVSIYLVIQHVSIATFALATVTQVIVLWPLIFRYSRVIWMHVDQMLDPRVIEDRTIVEQ
jgi:uncharacterized protein (DUF983 family)